MRTSSYDNDDDDGNRRSGGKNDSTAGKLMEKVGSAFNSDSLESKGRAKREEKGYGDDDY